MRDYDMNRQIQSDVNMVKRLNRKSIRDISPMAAFEYIMWTLAMLSGLGMMIAIPWVGPEGVIPGHIWMGYSLVCILLFGGLGGLFRWLKHAGGPIDEGMNRRVDNSRGR